MNWLDIVLVVLFGPLLLLFTYVILRITWFIVRITWCILLAALGCKWAEHYLRKI